MSLRQRGAGSPATSSSTRGEKTLSLRGHPCGALARVLARAFREVKPEILDLGPLWGDSVTYLAGRGARVYVENFEPPRSIPPRRPGEAPAEIEPVRFDQPDGRMHLVLAWEMSDFVPPERLVEYGSELRRVLRDGGMLFLLSHGRPPAEREVPVRYLLLADDMVVREPSRMPLLRRYVHPNREIERALAGFSIEGIHLQRSQMREITAVKVPVG